MPHRAREIIVKTLGWTEDRVRVVCPDVGGGFGPKFVIYSEEIVVPLAACLLRRPVKWIEDRREHFTATTMERDQIWKVRAAADAEGRLLALDIDMLHDHGAATPHGINVPQNSGTNVLGPYRLPAFEFTASVVLTNKTPVTPTRGAGRPQGTFAMERALDALAGKLGLDRAEIRRRNLIQPAARCPTRRRSRTRDGGIMTYDSGDYPASQALALDKAGYADFPARQAAGARARPLHRPGTCQLRRGLGTRPVRERARSHRPDGPRRRRDGRDRARPGHRDRARADRRRCARRRRSSTSASSPAIRRRRRSASARSPAGRRPSAGRPCTSAATEVRDKAMAAAATILDCSAQDIEIADGVFSSRRDTAANADLWQIASAAAAPPGFALPKGSTPGLEAICNFVPEAMTYNNGTHVAEVEVDIRDRRGRGYGATSSCTTAAA